MLVPAIDEACLIGFDINTLITSRQRFRYLKEKSKDIQIKIKLN